MIPPVMDVPGVAVIGTIERAIVGVSRTSYRYGDSPAMPCCCIAGGSINGPHINRCEYRGTECEAKGRPKGSFAVMVPVGIVVVVSRMTRVMV